MVKQVKAWGANVLALLSATIVLAIGVSVIGVVPAQASEDYASQASVESAVSDTRAYVLNQFAGYASSGTALYGTSSEWMLMSLARDLNGTENQLFSQYHEQAVAVITANKGYVTSGSQKPTDYERIILALTAMGYDATNIGGYNLFDYLSTMDNVTPQGVNSVIFALLAVESDPSYTFLNPSDGSTATTIPGLIDYLLGKELSTDGGWALYGTKGDVDVTSMALQALAPFKGSAYDTGSKVSDAIDRGLAMLSSRQGSQGEYKSLGFGGDGDANSNSQAQVVTALAALNVSPSDPRFVKNGHTVIENMLSYHVAGSGFRYLPTQAGANGMATEQCYYATIAYERQMTGKNSLYNMGDVTLGDAGVKKAEAAAKAAADKAAADKAAAEAAAQQGAQNGAGAAGSTPAGSTTGTQTSGAAASPSGSTATGLNSGFDTVVKENSGYTRPASPIVTNNDTAGVSTASGARAEGSTALTQMTDASQQKKTASRSGIAGQSGAASATESAVNSASPVASVVSEPVTYRIVQRAASGDAVSVPSSSATKRSSDAAKSDAAKKKASDSDNWSFSTDEYEPTAKKSAANATSASASTPATVSVSVITAIALLGVLVVAGVVGGCVARGRRAARSAGASHAAQSHVVGGE